MHYNPRMEARLKPGFLAKVLIPAVALILFGVLLSVLPSISNHWQPSEKAVLAYPPPEDFEKSSGENEGSTLEQAGLEALSAGDPGAARTNLEEASQYGDLSPAGWMALGDANRSLGDLDNALAAWTNLPPSEDLYKRLTEVHYQLDNIESLLVMMRSLLAQFPGEASLYFHTGLIYAAQRPDSSIAYLEQAVSIEPRYKEDVARIIRTIRTTRLLDEPAYTLVSSGRELAYINHWILAYEAFRQAISLREDYAEAWAFYGEAIQQADNLIQEYKTDRDENHRALTALQKAVELDPESIAAQIFLSTYWQRQGAYEQAAEILESAALQEPENPVLWAEIGSCWAKAGDLLKAQTYLQKALDHAQDDPFYWALVAEYSIEHQVQLRELGLPAARQAVMLAPHSAEYLTLLGKTLYFLGDHSNADKFLKEALDKELEYAPAYLYLGMNSLAQGSSIQARDYFNQASSHGAGTSTAEQANRLLERHFP
jgi:tetratricopeptide (TPR) repeat protein